MCPGRMRHYRGKTARMFCGTESKITDLTDPSNQVHAKTSFHPPAIVPELTMRPNGNSVGVAAHTGRQNCASRLFRRCAPNFPRSSMVRLWPANGFTGSNIRIIRLVSLLLLVSWTTALSGPARLGDIDGDGEPSIVDLVYVINHLNGAIPLPETLLPFADLDENGVINETDVRILADAILGIGSLPNPTAPPILISPIDSTPDTTVHLSGNTRPFREVIVSGGAYTVVVVAGADGAFSADVPLVTNRLNQLLVASTNAVFGLGSSRVVNIIQDRQAPSLFIDVPANGAMVLTSNLVVAGRVGDFLSGSKGISVSISNSTPGSTFATGANVYVGLGNNGTFERGAIPLAVGNNSLVVAASDIHGNTTIRQIVVRREVSRGMSLTAVSGDLQTTNISRNLAEPLVVRIANTNGQPIRGKLVTFDVSRSDGRLRANESATSAATRRLQLFTDETGIARAWWTLGTGAGCGNNRVTVSSRSIGGTLTFCATAIPGSPVQVNLGSGNNQVTEVESSPPKSLRVWVTDTCNGVPRVPVTFTVIQGDGTVNGRRSVTVQSSRTGHADVNFVAGTNVGVQRVEANFEGSVNLPAVFSLTSLRRDPAQPTRLSGVVLDNSYQPIVGVLSLLTVGERSFEIKTDAYGRFEFINVPQGRGTLQLDGTVATAAGSNSVPLNSFPSLPFPVFLLPNSGNALEAPVILPTLNPANARVYHGTNDVDLTTEGVEGVRLHVKAGSLRLADGSVPNAPVTLSVNQIHYDQMPMPPPDGAAPVLMFTLQPFGLRFDPPVQMELPNVNGMAPGEEAALMSYYFETEAFEITARTHITEDGSTSVTDPGEGIHGFWNHLICRYIYYGRIRKGQNGNGNSPNYSDSDVGGDNRTPPKSSGLPSSDGKGTDHPQNHQGGDPVTLAFGELVLTETDLSIPGRGFPFEMIRTYRSRFGNNGPAGWGWDFNCNQRLDLSGVFATPARLLWLNGYGRVDEFTFIPSLNAFEAARGSYVRIRQLDGQTLVARDRQGFKSFFNQQGFLIRQADRFGNQMEFVRDDTGQLNQVIDTLGRLISFSYYPNKRLKEVRDFTGRAIKYGYDENGDLVVVRSPLVIGTSTGNDFLQGKTTRYEYLSGYSGTSAALNHNLESIIDPSGQRFLLNTYGTSPDSYEFDRIVRQEAGRPDQVYSFRYRRLNPTITDPGPSVPKNETIQIDPNENQSIFTHNDGGNLLEARVQSNRNVNPEDPAEFLTRHAYNTDGERIQTTFPEGNSIVYTYDSGNSDSSQRGNLLSTAFMPGPRDADQPSRVITRRYEPIYNQVREVTDERGNLATFVPPNGAANSPSRYSTHWVFDYQEGNNLSSLAAELGRSQSDTAALLASVAVSLNLGDVNGDGETAQAAGNVVQVRQPSVRLLADSEQARLEGVTEQPIVTQFAYNRFGQLVSMIDPEGNAEDYFYHPEKDPDGDGRTTTATRSLASDTGGYLAAAVRDARTTPARRSTTIPARIRSESFYDPVGNVIRRVDGRGNDTLYEVNALNQIVAVTARAPFRFLRRIHYDANDNIAKEEVQNVFVNGPNLGAYAATTYTYDINNNRKTMTQWPSGSEALVTLYDYDRNNNLVRVTQPAGNVAESVFDERNLLYSVTRGAGTTFTSTRRMTYDGNGNLVKILDAEDNNADGQPDATRFEYDGYDRMRRALDAVGNERRVSYDPADNVIRVQRLGLNGGPSRLDNSGAGNVVLSDTEASFDELNRAFQHDSRLFANLTTVGPEGPLTPGDLKVTTRFEFDRNGRRTRVLDDNRHQATFEYDGVNRLVRELDHLDNERRTAYDANHNPTNITVIERSPENLVQPETFVTRREYDSLDRLTTVIDNLGNLVSFGYDSRDNQISKVDALGNATLFIFDGLRRKVAEIVELRVGGTGSGALDTSSSFNSDGRIVTAYKWDANSRLASVTDDRGNETAYGYDSLNRKTLERFADGTMRMAVYDRDDNLTFLRDQNGSAISSRYDAINRLVRVDVVRGAGVEGTTLRTYEYDGLSRITRSIDNNDPSTVSDEATLDWRYDSLGDLLVETQNGITIATKFDGVGNRLSCTYPDGRVVETDYDELNRPAIIRDRGSASSLAQYDYLGKSRVLERRNGNGTRLRLHDGSGNQTGYDALRRQITIRHENAAGALLAGSAHAYDRADNRRYGVDLISATADAYEYDSGYRLTRARRGAPVSALSTIRNNDNVNADVAAIVAPNNSIYTLDGVANWRRRMTNGVPVDYTVNEMNEYGIISGGIGGGTKIYDDNGNLIHDGSRRYYYDFGNRLVRATASGGAEVARYAYDTLGRRTAKTVSGTTTGLFYDGLHLIEERVGGSALRQYVFGLGLDEVLELQTGVTRYFYHQDSLGSVVALTDSGGQVIERYRYDEYGVTSVLAENGTGRSASLVGNPYRYTGRWLDEETQLYDYRLRYYSPESGKFLQHDPIGFLGGMSLLSYTGGNPINWRDPLGLSPEKNQHQHRNQARDDLLRLGGAIWGLGAGVIKTLEVAEIALMGPMDQKLQLGNAMFNGLTTLGSDIVHGDFTALAQHAAPGLYHLATEGEAGGIFNSWFAIGPEIGLIEGGAQVVIKLARGGLGSAAGASGEIAAARSVATPHGAAVQATTAEAQAALRQVQSGAPVYRQGWTGTQRTFDSQNWALQNPATTPNFADQLGMPATATQGEYPWMMGGRVTPGAPVITRPAPGIGGNVGGSMEAVVNPGGVGIDWFHMP